MSGKVQYDQYGNRVYQPAGAMAPETVYVDQYGNRLYPQQQQPMQQGMYDQRAAAPASSAFYAAAPAQSMGHQPQPPIAQAVHVQAIRPEKETTGWRDWPFALLFLGNVVTMGVLLVMYGIDAIRGSNSIDKSDSFLSSSDTQKIIWFALAFIAIASVMAFLMLRLIVKFAKFAITFALWFTVGIAFAFAFLGFAMGSIVVGIIGLIFAALSLCYAWMVRDRIPFAAANLQVAAAAVKTHSSMYLIAILVLILQVGWIALWSVSFVGVLSAFTDVVNPNGKKNDEVCSTNSQCQSDSCVEGRCSFQPLQTTSSISYFFMILSFYWGVTTLKNVAHVTVSGTVATWWFQTESKGATGSSFKRAMTTSFGSICLGSLIVAIIKTLRQIAQESARNGDSCACLAECILGCIERIVEYFNKWAFVYVGIYGFKFTKAGKAVFDLFKQRGFTAIINDDLIGNALGMAAVATGLVCAGLGVGYYYIQTDMFSFSNGQVVLGVLGFLIGVGVAIIPLSVVDSSVATVFVLFAEDPNAFQQNRPELYQPLVAAWYKAYPDTMVAGGYLA